MPPLILASASPRRAQLLTTHGYHFTIIASPAPEPARKPALIPVELWPICLAYLKAAAVQNQIKNQIKNQKSKIKNQIILAADTIVVVDTPTAPIILNKPANRAHARRMLRLLSGKIHRVITGICLLSPTGLRLASAQAQCRLAKFSPQRLEAYLNSNLWKGKAGAYGIQDRGDPLVTLLSGEMTTVMGLPMPLLKTELANFAKD